MPREDGITFLKDLMSSDPIPVVICSSHSTEGSREALEALREGAVDVVAKPQLRVREFVKESAVLLADAVRAAAKARARPRSTARVAVQPVIRQPRLEAGKPSERVIAIAASTGGPQAIEQVLTHLPASAPGIVVVQHMPAGFTTAFAKYLDSACELRVKEAQDGELIVDGCVLIAPGDHHLLVRRQHGRLVAHVTAGPLVSRHRPSADVLFESVAQVGGSAALGVIMTGMGGDGAKGLAAMRAAGAATLAQDQATCVVFGMPKEAMAKNAVQEIVPLGGIADRIKRWYALDNNGRKGEGDELHRIAV